MNKIELFVMKYTGLIITSMGLCGAIITMLVDDIRQRPFEFGWLQALGVCVFLVTMFLGVFITKFLTSVREMLEKYLSQ